MVCHQSLFNDFQPWNGCDLRPKALVPRSRSLNFEEMNSELAVRLERVFQVLRKFFEMLLSFLDFISEKNHIGIISNA
jgi:hypothetical protein